MKEGLIGAKSTVGVALGLGEEVAMLSGCKMFIRLDRFWFCSDDGAMPITNNTALYVWHSLRQQVSKDHRRCRNYAG